jgi:hypothetical protein
VLSGVWKDIAASRFVPWLVVGMVLSALACLSIGGVRTLPVGESAPDFSWQVEDRERALSDYQGSVIVVSFWSST